MDIIKIEELEVYAFHGVFNREKEEGQFFYLNASLSVDTRNAGLNDDLTMSVHYGEVAHFMNDYMKNNRCYLIEAAAEQLAEAVLIAFDKIKKIKLEIRKPYAPVGLPFQSVSVQIERGWKKAYVAFGSNMGDKKSYVNHSIGEMRSNKLIKNVVVSDMLESKPYGEELQNSFLNGVVEIETLMYPEELLSYLFTLEHKAGRKREIHWGPRTLDLDLLLYEDIVMNTPELTLPHCDMHNRDFVLKPLKQLAPYLMHPLYHKTVEQLLGDLDEEYVIK